MKASLMTSTKEPFVCLGSNQFFGKIKSQFKIKHECQFELTFCFLVDCDAAGRMLALSPGLLR